jgi:hypothetical protein
MRDCWLWTQIVVEHEKRDAVTIQDCENINIEIQGMPKAVNITGCPYHCALTLAELFVL